MFENLISLSEMVNWYGYSIIISKILLSRGGYEYYSAK